MWYNPSLMCGDSIAMLLGRVCAFIKPAFYLAKQHQSTRGAERQEIEDVRPYYPSQADIMWLLVMPRPRKESASEKQNMSLYPACLAEHVLICQITVNVLFFFPPLYSPSSHLSAQSQGQFCFNKGKYVSSGW